MRRKKEEHINLERWVISYADFITLLFAFFVVMYAIANQDKSKIKKIVTSIQRNFFGPPGKLDLGVGSAVRVRDRYSLRGRIMDLPMGKMNAEPVDNRELENLARSIEDSIALQMQTTDLKDIFELVYEDNGLVIRLVANDLFYPGKAEIKRKYLVLINQVSQLLSKTDYVVHVEGHTDSTPVLKNSRYPSNWELSGARAAWIVRYIIARYKFPASRISAGGYANGHPIASNKTPAGRQRNRRIEIVITKLVKK